MISLGVFYLQSAESADEENAETVKKIDFGEGRRRSRRIATSIATRRGHVASPRQQEWETSLRGRPR